MEPRVRYLEAAVRFLDALRHWELSGMPMDPGPVDESRPWTEAHHRAVSAVLDALVELRDARRAWDMARRQER
jgi:hypothetical protein